MGLGLGTDGQLHADVAAFKDIDRIHDVMVVGGFERDIGADFVARDPSLTPIIQDINLLRAVVIGSGHGVVSSDGGIGCHDLLVSGRDHLLAGICRPFHDQVPGSGAGAVANLVVVHHAP